MTAIVAAVIDRLSGQYPRMTFHVRVADTAVLLPELRERNLDLAISRIVGPSPLSDLKAEIPRVMLRFPIYRGSLKALPIDLAETRRPIAFVTLKKRDLNPVAKLFLSCAREVVSALAIAK